MFFNKTPKKQRKFAERVVKNFCLLARGSNVSPDEQIQCVDITLGPLKAMLNFRREEEDLRQAQKELQTSSEKAIDPETSKQLFTIATAMNTLILYFSKDENDEQRKIFVDVVKATVEQLKLKRESLEKSKLAEPGNSSMSKSSLLH